MACKLLTYHDLPVHSQSGLVLHCPTRGNDYSACRGDYFQLQPDTPIRCYECRTALVLARTHTVYDVEV